MRLWWSNSSRSSRRPVSTCRPKRTFHRNACACFSLRSSAGGEEPVLDQLVETYPRRNGASRPSRWSGCRAGRPGWSLRSARGCRRCRGSRWWRACCSSTLASKNACDCQMSSGRAHGASPGTARPGPRAAAPPSASSSTLTSARAFACAFVERAHAVADLEPDVPEEREEALDAFVRRRQRRSSAAGSACRCRNSGCSSPRP